MNRTLGPKCLLLCGPMLLGLRIMVLCLTTTAALLGGAAQHLTTCCLGPATDKPSWLSLHQSQNGMRQLMLPKKQHRKLPTSRIFFRRLKCDNQKAPSNKNVSTKLTCVDADTSVCVRITFASSVTLVISNYSTFQVTTKKVIFSQKYYILHSMRHFVSLSIV